MVVLFSFLVQAGIEPNTQSLNDDGDKGLYWVSNTVKFEEEHHLEIVNFLLRTNVVVDVTHSFVEVLTVFNCLLIDLYVIYFNRVATLRISAN